MTITATLIYRFTYENPFSYSKWDEGRGYIFKDERRKYIWKTTGHGMQDKNKESVKCVIGNKYSFEATEKGVITYKDEEETVLIRCKNFECVAEKEYAPVKKGITKAEQMATLKEGDQIITMDYARYKKHYSDCEKVVGSYVAFGCGEGGEQYIDVIVRAGRMKNSGVRGKSYGYYRFETPEGEYIDLKAISEETASRRVPEGSKLVGEGYSIGHNTYRIEMF